MSVEVPNAPPDPIRRLRIRLNGIVQGVGFRPFVFRLAQNHGLSGFVNNDGAGVLIEVEGRSAGLEEFRARLHADPPPLACIVDSEVEEIAPAGGTAFTIRESRRDVRPVTLISPDVAVCDACLREMLDPADRRHLYPFINCTNCGPRYTITRGIPYDRANTSMSVFDLCPGCRREYEDPADRRFHAQPNACGLCGPRLALWDREGRAIAAADPIGAAAERLRGGECVAIRGLGGFHLAVDAFRESAVLELRRRKGRAEKPFAMMAPDLPSVARHCRLSEAESRQLLLPSRPILLLERRPGSALAPSVAPGSRYFGFMLPSAPLHHLLLRGRFEALVMTSGNLSEEPIATGNEEARERLRGVADAFLVHDREILQRCDDSIVQVHPSGPVVLRRSRGYVPAPVLLARPTGRRILAVGGELKNTIALSRGRAVFLSQHIGDLDNPKAMEFFEESIAHLGSILEIVPEVVAHDLHPEYLSTKWALGRSRLRSVAVQHHHAHLASVLAENGSEGPAIGVILDGTGYGTDGAIWGGEILVGGCGGFVRHAWLQEMPLPGGAAAIRHPWRMAISALHAAYGSGAADLRLPFLEAIPPREIEIVRKMVERRINAPPTSSCGRLFDAVSAMAGVRSTVDYEAQAAIELEAALDESEEGWYEAAVEGISGAGAIATVPLIRSVAEDVRRRAPAGRISARFHRTLAEILARAAMAAREAHGVGTVALSGGVFQNAHLLRDLSERLRRHGFIVLTHRIVPPNDGGLALGQVAVADAVLDRE